MTWKLEHEQEYAMHSNRGRWFRQQEHPMLKWGGASALLTHQRWDGWLGGAGSRQIWGWTSSRSQIMDGFAGLSNEFKIHLVNDEEP